MGKSFKIALITIFMGWSLQAYAGLPTIDSQGKALPSLAPMLKKINPAVVNISTFSTKAINNPLMNDPFFKHFFNQPDTRQQQRPKKQKQSAGSGVIVNAGKGTVITNYHVIKGADEVQVSLVDGRTYLAEVTGSDPDLDIAILSIDANKLTDIKIGDSSALQVGDFVVAIGNPFGLGQTATTGIVSALERTGLGIEGYENFIQTDASINPGNSGGALVNLKGELIGINTAIIAPAGGNVGIGFAIPVDMAAASMEQIIQHGEVRRGQIGVSIQDITPDLRKAFNLKNGQRGVLISGVAKNSSAEKVGLLPGDVIIAVNKNNTESAGQLRSQIGIKRIGDSVKITIMRDGKKKKLDVMVGKPHQGSASISGSHPLLEGATFEDNAKGDGLIITNLAPNSTAAFSGLRKGDIIVGTNRMRVNSIKELEKALQRDKNKVLLHINRNGGSFYLVIR
ncbi:MAG: Do family serine endopeptidase [Gammaproteobacteria bacterium]|nr:Do family serine endopeptidase [Gammaproteobacteria bacterium]